AALPERDLAGLVRVRDVEDAEPALEAGLRPIGRLRLAVDHHDAAGGAHLVRVHAAGHGHAGELARPRGITDVDDGGALGGVHVGDERHAAVHDHLPAARAIEIPDLPEPGAAVGGWHGSLYYRVRAPRRRSSGLRKARRMRSPSCYSERRKFRRSCWADGGRLRNRPTTALASDGP